jgi:hypothetical protein
MLSLSVWLAPTLTARQCCSSDAKGKQKQKQKQEQKPVAKKEKGDRNRHRANIEFVLVAFRMLEQR